MLFARLVLLTDSLICMRQKKTVEFLVFTSKREGHCWTFAWLILWWSLNLKVMLIYVFGASDESEPHETARIHSKPHWNRFLMDMVRIMNTRNETWSSSGQFVEIKKLMRQPHQHNLILWRNFNMYGTTLCKKRSSTQCGCSIHLSLMVDFLLVN